MAGDNGKNGLPDHLSVSQINQYLMCPLKYRFHYLDRLPKPFKAAELAFGSAIHAAIEWYHKHRLINGAGPGWADVARIFEADLKAQALDAIRYKKGENLDSLIEKGKSVLACYLKEYREVGVQAVEMPFRVPLVDLDTGEALPLPLDGYIDLVEAEDTVVELKTAAKVFSPIEVVQHLQLSAYAYAFGWLYKRTPSLRIDILTKTKEPALHSFSVGRDEKSLVRFFHIAKSVLSAIEQGHFYPNEGWQCQGCEYFEPCQSWKTENHTEIRERRKESHAKESV